MIRLERMPSQQDLADWTHLPIVLIPLIIDYGGHEWEQTRSWCLLEPSGEPVKNFRLASLDSQGVFTAPGECDYLLEYLLTSFGSSALLAGSSGSPRSLLTSFESSALLADRSPLNDPDKNDVLPLKPRRRIHLNLMGTPRDFYIDLRPERKTVINPCYLQIYDRHGKLVSRSPITSEDPFAARNAVPEYIPRLSPFEIPTYWAMTDTELYPVNPGEGACALGDSKAINIPGAISWAINATTIYALFSKRLIIIDRKVLINDRKDSTSRLYRTFTHRARNARLLLGSHYLYVYRHRGQQQVVEICRLDDGECLTAIPVDGRLVLVQDLRFYTYCKDHGLKEYRGRSMVS
jgi:hypothetical protein